MKEKIKILTFQVPFQSQLKVELNGVDDQINKKIDEWDRAEKPKSYRIINATTEEIAHRSIILYSTFIAYLK